MKCAEEANPENQKVVERLPRAQGVVECGVTSNENRVSLGGNENVLELDGGDRWTALWIY